MTKTGVWYDKSIFGETGDLSVLVSLVLLLSKPRTHLESGTEVILRHLLKLSSGSFSGKYFLHENPWDTCGVNTIKEIGIRFSST